MQRLYRLMLLVFTLICILAVSQPAAAQDAVLSNIIVTNTRDDLLVYLTVEGAFRDKIQQAIYSGVPVTFSFYVTLHQIRSLWLNREIVSLHITHAIKYNSLKNEFVVERSWEDNVPHTVASFEEAQRLMSDVDSLKVLPLERLEKGGHYRIAAKARLSQVTLPFYLHYILFFVSLWDFETDWYSMDFIY